MDVISWQRIVVNPTRSVYALITRLYGASNSASPAKQEPQESPVKMTSGGNRISFDGTYAPPAGGTQSGSISKSSHLSDLLF